MCPKKSGSFLSTTAKRNANRRVFTYNWKLSKGQEKKILAYGLYILLPPALGLLRCNEGCKLIKSQSFTHFFTQTGVAALIKIEQHQLFTCLSGS